MSLWKGMGREASLSLKVHLMTLGICQNIFMRTVLASRYLSHAQQSVRFSGNFRLSSPDVAPQF